MGEMRVSLATTQEEVQRFMKAVLRDVRALEQMLHEQWFETRPIRIGAEQELCLVDAQGKAAPWSMEVLQKLAGHAQFTTEFARFNLESNLSPQVFSGACFKRMEAELQGHLDLVRQVVHAMGGDILLCGILPTIRPSDLDMKNLTPLERYRALADAISSQRGGELDLKIQGTDELRMTVDSPLLEACNTGFQVHLQVAPDDFVAKYNMAQLITAPVLAAGVGSPLFFGKRLWAETRIALFQQSVDTRKVGHHLREDNPRVTAGNDWVDGGVLEIFRENVLRYRVMLSADVEEDVDALLAAGTPPGLNALQVHSGTVWRWNRPCYGVAGGKPHLRIENRVLPSGPTVTDEMANAAFWLGLMSRMTDLHTDVRKEIDFSAARRNFVAAAKQGLETSFHWFGERTISATELILQELLPIAREGLQKMAVDADDVDHYLDVIRERVQKGQTASSWMVGNYNRLMSDQRSRQHALTAITQAMVKNQAKGEPVHQWGRVRLEDIAQWQPSSLLVEEFMTTDLFTVQRADLLELVANLIEWRNIRYVLVEDGAHRLVGLVTMRGLFKHFNSALGQGRDLPETVADVMLANPITIHPEASIIEALDIMGSQKIGCLPVVRNNRLVGIITEQNFNEIASRVIRAFAVDKKPAAGAAG